MQSNEVNNQEVKKENVPQDADVLGAYTGSQEPIQLKEDYDEEDTSDSLIILKILGWIFALAILFAFLSKF